MSEFKNENLSVKVERLPGAKVKFEISVSPKATKAAHVKAMKNINKEIVVPGFRKGKAPENLITEKFKNQIDQESKDVLLNTAFHEAMELTNIFPLAQNTIKPEIKSLSDENGAELIITFESRPEIPEINPKDITLKNVTPAPVTEKEIKDRLYELQLNQATWDNIEDRGVQEGDFVSLDIESLDQPGLVLCTNETFIASKDNIGSWLYNLILNQKPSAVVEGMSEKEECKSCDDPTHDHSHDHEHEPEFKPSNLKVTIKGIKKPILPEINDEFASKIGAETVDVLNTRVVSSLEKNSKDRAQQNLRNQLNEILISKYPFDIPASILKGSGKTHDEKTMNNIINSYRIYFITQKLAKDLNLTVSENEIMEEFMVQAYMTNPKESFIDTSADPKEIQHRIHSYLLEKKVKDYLIEHANIG